MSLWLVSPWENGECPFCQFWHCMIRIRKMGSPMRENKASTSDDRVSGPQHQTVFDEPLAALLKVVCDPVGLGSDGLLPVSSSQTSDELEIRETLSLSTIPSNLVNLGLAKKRPIPFSASGAECLVHALACSRLEPKGLATTKKF
ncbi:hypothetical protein PG988_002019 [Apiospora saccharicola]